MIYSFFMYLLAYLEDEYGNLGVYLSTKEEVPHMWGIQLVLRKPWQMGDEFLWQCKKVRRAIVSHNCTLALYKLVISSDNHSLWTLSTLCSPSGESPLDMIRANQPGQMQERCLWALRSTHVHLPKIHPMPRHISRGSSDIS